MKRIVVSAMSCIAAVTAMAALPDVIQFGNAFVAEGDISAAANSYAEALTVNPQNPVALNNLGVVKAAAGEYQAALVLFTQANKLAPSRADIQENLIHLQAWVRSYTGVKTAAIGSAPLPEPPPLWPSPAVTGIDKNSKPNLISGCKIYPCK